MNDLKNLLKALRSEQLGKNARATTCKKKGVRCVNPACRGCDPGRRLTLRRQTACAAPLSFLCWVELRAH